MFSETIARFLIYNLGQAAYFGFVVVLLFVAPLLLVWLVTAPLIHESERGSRYGLLLVSPWGSGQPLRALRAIHRALSESAWCSSPPRWRQNSLGRGVLHSRYTCGALAALGMVRIPIPAKAADEPSFAPFKLTTAESTLY